MYFNRKSLSRFTDKAVRRMTVSNKKKKSFYVICQIYLFVICEFKSCTLLVEFK